MKNTLEDNYRSWMTQFPELHNKNLRELILPGTHHSDSVTLTQTYSCCLATSLLKFIPPALAQALAIAQKTSVTHQLDRGVRYFDLRNCFDHKDQEFYTHHQVRGAPSRDALKQIAAFMQIPNQQELVIIEVNYSNGSDHDLLDLVKAHLNPYLYRRPSADALLADIRLGDIVEEGSKVVALYNHADFEKSGLKFSEYPEFWPFSTNMRDIYSGEQNITDLEAYLKDELAIPTDNSKLAKIQFILEWKLGVLSSSLEGFEHGLPKALPPFMTRNWKSKRINILFNDFYEKVYQYVMPLVLAMNLDNSNINALGSLLSGQIIPQTYGTQIWTTYNITSRLSQDGKLYNLTAQDDNTLTIEIADQTNARQQWKITPNTPAGGYALFNVSTNSYLCVPNFSKGTRVKMCTKYGTENSSFDIVESSQKNGSLVIRTHKDESKNLNIYGGEAAPGKPIILYPWEGGKENMEWSFSPV